MRSLPTKQEASTQIALENAPTGTKRTHFPDPPLETHPLLGLKTYLLRFQGLDVGLNRVNVHQVVSRASRKPAAAKARNKAQTNHTQKEKIIS